MSYDWPGNVRELENIIERELILNKGEALSFHTLDGTHNAKHSEFLSEIMNTSLTLDKVNTYHIQRVLKKTKGIVHGPNGAAAILGINPSTLRSKMKKLGILYGRRKG
jgi:DNA-binding NtrC family response regulator